MAKWAGWIAALGGLISILQITAFKSMAWLGWTGGILAIIFGIIAGTTK